MNTTNKNHLYQVERTKITRELLKYDILRGLVRDKSKGHAITAISNALYRVGFCLPLVCGDTLLGDHGARFLTLARINEGTDETNIENASIYFVWEKLDENRMEFLAYVS